MRQVSTKPGKFHISVKQTHRRDFLAPLSTQALNGFVQLPGLGGGGGKTRCKVVSRTLSHLSELCSESPHWPVQQTQIISMRDSAWTVQQQGTKQGLFSLVLEFYAMFLTPLATADLTLLALINLFPKCLAN